MLTCVSKLKAHGPNSWSLGVDSSEADPIGLDEEIEELLIKARIKIAERNLQSQQVQKERE